MSQWTMTEIEDLLFQLEEDERYLKRKRLFIIIGVVTILLAILIIVLCVCLSGKSKDEKKNRFF